MPVSGEKMASGDTTVRAENWETENLNKRKANTKEKKSSDKPAVSRFFQ